MASRWDKIRAFIAVDIDDPQVVSRLVQIRDLFVNTGTPMKPVEDYNMHITLRFLGEIPSTLIEDIYANVLSKLRFRRFRIRLVGVGAFPSITRPRVIWVGVREGSDELQRLYREIESGLRRMGFRPEREEFVPHVTLARIKGSRNIERVVKLLQEYADVELGEFEVRVVRLKQSILTPRGPIYKTLKEVTAVEGE
ncbi:2'-5' RNA ligase [Pyrolobus fumarii 1A]|uniref:RNA 2',3'-cyclic phosphodiesterase n=1 Tax=Pyrolobus fumarii (strain DSM 11204 / 1A) TaxID=694429 RepID=G0EEG0_PYRF1|nr:RNA 2',3'-cyclic phosphodiesterase [Pyrolobus fumarii]AEM38001.1 2'-5' RNA ligase [Pyrolobus fumarii 1A]